MGAAAQPVGSSTSRRPNAEMNSQDPAADEERFQTHWRAAWGWGWPSPSRSRPLMRRRPTNMTRILPPTKRLPNSQRVLQLVTSDKWGTCGMLRHCLIHPVAPLLSLLAPLFRPFFSPVRSLPDAASLRFKPLKSHGFLLGFRRRAGGKRVFRPVIPAKTGERPRRCCKEAIGIRIVRRGAKAPAHAGRARVLPVTFASH